MKLMKNFPCAIDATNTTNSIDSEKMYVAPYISEIWRTFVASEFVCVRVDI